jgi:hypothetical protein
MFSLSKLELKSAFLSLFCCGLLKLEGVSFIGLPSRKLFALEDQSCTPPHVEHTAYAVDAKIAIVTMRAMVTRRNPDRFIISPVFTFSFYSFSNYIFLTLRNEEIMFSNDPNYSTHSGTVMGLAIPRNRTLRGAALPGRNKLCCTRPLSKSNTLLRHFWSDPPGKGLVFDWFQTSKAGL